MLESPTAPIKDLRSFVGNPRRGNVDAIADSLRANGQYRPIVVNRGTLTGRENEVLAGNHTLAAAKKLGWTEIGVSYVDVDEETAKRIVLVDNRAGDLAEYDNDALLDLLGSIEDFTGTGYDDAAIEAMLTPPLVTPEKGPAPGSADFLEAGESQYQEQYAVTVMCSDALDQENVYRRLTDEGYKCRVVTV